MGHSYRWKVAISVSIMAMSFGVFTIVFRSFGQEFEKRGLEIAQRRTEVIKISRTSEVLANHKKREPKAASYGKLINIILPGQEDSVFEFPKWVEGLSRVRQVETHLSFTSEPTLPTETSAGYASFSLKMTGRYDEILLLIKDIELTVPRYQVSIESVTIAYLGGTGYGANVLGKVYFRNDATTPIPKE